MKILKQCLGIDVSKDKLDACLGFLNEDLSSSIKLTKQYENSTPGIANLLKDVKPFLKDGLYVTMEATGVYHELVAYSFFNKGASVSILLPNKAKAFIRSINIRVKTDKVDAKLLCMMGLERKLDSWHPPKKIFAQLKILTREKETIIKERISLKNKLHAMEAAFITYKKSITRLNRRIAFLTKQIEIVEQEIKDLIKSDQVISKKVDNITRANGISTNTVAIVVAETNGFEFIRSQKQLVGFAGIDVQIHQSGNTSSKGHISKKGNKQIRKALYMPALNAVNTNEQFKRKYLELNQRQSAKKQGIIAVERKMLLLIYTLWKNNQAYDPNFYKKHLDFCTV